MNLGDKLLSRKFWAMAVGATALFLVHAYEQVATVLVAYMAVQAAVDFGESWTNNRTTAPEPTPVSPASNGDDEEVSGWTGSVI